jgi:hypothetical protein
MNENYRLIKRCNYYIFQRLIYPRFEIMIDIESAPMIKEFRYFESCSPAELKVVMEEVSVHFRRMFMETLCKDPGNVPAQKSQETAVMSES